MTLCVLDSSAALAWVLPDERSQPGDLDLLKRILLRCGEDELVPLLAVCEGLAARLCHCDDYGIPEDTCRRAISNFRNTHAITEKTIDIDGMGVYWRRAPYCRAHRARSP